MQGKGKSLLMYDGIYQQVPSLIPPVPAGPPALYFFQIQYLYIFLQYFQHKIYSSMFLFQVIRWSHFIPSNLKIIPLFSFISGQHYSISKIVI